MLLLRISVIFFCLLTILAAYPMNVPMKSKPSGYDPADYPDLTNGLTDAQVELTLNGLSLDDLHALNKLLDDADTGPAEIEASLKGRYRQAKKKHYEEAEAAEEAADSSELSSSKQSFEEGCSDDDDMDKEKDSSCTERPKCNKKPQCTKRCTVKKCFTPSCSTSVDDFINLDSNYNDSPKKHHKYKKHNSETDECDPEDEICLQRVHGRNKQRTNMHDFSDMTLHEEEHEDNKDDMDQMPVEAHDDNSFNFKKELDEYSIDFNKVPNDFKVLSKADSDWAPDKVSDYEERPLVQSDNTEKQMERFEHYETQPEEKVEDKRQHNEMERIALEDNMQLNEAPIAPEDNMDNMEYLGPAQRLGENMGMNDADSFIAKNARDPLRYVIQTDDGYIKSDDEPFDNRLRTDKQQSEMLNFDTDQLTSDVSSNQSLDEDTKRSKRNNHKTDDSAEHANESYLKKLLDSFPRDQSSQSNLKMAIRQANRAHLRVKRS